jgi:REP element-mobilizing transposase RayT
VSVLFETARRYRAAQKWYLKLLLLMPDHLHMLVGVPRDAQLSNLIRDFKRITTRVANITWQRNFSTIDCDTMRARMTKSHIFVRILFAQE